MPNNCVIPMHQVTVDKTYHVGDRMTEVAAEFARQKLFGEEVQKIFEYIAVNGLDKDINLRLDAEDGLKEASDYLVEALGIVPEMDIGGNPGITAMRGYRLGEGQPNGRLPIFKYAGLYPESLREFVATQDANHRAVLDDVFDSDICFAIDDRPQTIALESNYKVILAYPPGRTLDYIDKDGDFSIFLDKVHRWLPEDREGRVLFVLSIPYPLDLGAKLISQIRDKFGHRARIFVGCSSLRQGDTPDLAKTRQIYEGILSQADVLSCNEVELSDLHTVVVGNGIYRDIPLAYKLRELPIDGIKVCHSAVGSLLDAGAQSRAGDQQCSVRAGSCRISRGDAEAGDRRRDLRHRFLVGAECDRNGCACVLEHGDRPQRGVVQGDLPQCAGAYAWWSGRGSYPHRRAAAVAAHRGRRQIRRSAGRLPDAVLSDENSH